MCVAQSCLLPRLEGASQQNAGGTYGISLRHAPLSEGKLRVPFPGYTTSFVPFKRKNTTVLNFNSGCADRGRGADA